MLKTIPSVLLVKLQNSDALLASEEILSQFQIPFTALSFPSNAPTANHSFYCVIAQADLKIQSWIMEKFPQLPILLVPQAQSASAETLKNYTETANQPANLPICSFAVGKAGASNAALFAAAMLATQNSAIRKKLLSYRKEQTQKILANPIPG